MYSFIKDCQKALQYALDDLIYSMSVLGQLYNLCNGNYEVSYNWNDSIIVNKDKELESMRADVAAGIIKPIYYIMKKYGVDEKTALDMMPDEPEDDNPDDLEE